MLVVAPTGKKSNDSSLKSRTYYRRKVGRHMRACQWELPMHD
jgi:hypothetical protein